MVALKYQLPRKWRSVALYSCQPLVLLFLLPLDPYPYPNLCLVAIKD